MSAKWKRAAYAEVDLGLADPDHAPRYRIPARQWWQLWKPKWESVEGVSQNQIRRACGVTAAAEPPMMRSLSDEIKTLFGFRF